MRETVFLCGRLIARRLFRFFSLHVCACGLPCSARAWLPDTREKTVMGCWPLEFVVDRSNDDRTGRLSESPFTWSGPLQGEGEEEEEQEEDEEAEVPNPSDSGCAGFLPTPVFSGKFDTQFLFCQFSHKKEARKRAPRFTHENPLGREARAGVQGRHQLI